MLDTDDPRLTTEGQRDLQQLFRGRTAVDLAQHKQGSWRRSWCRRDTPQHTQRILDNAERAAEVACACNDEGATRVTD